MSWEVSLSELLKNSIAIAPELDCKIHGISADSRTVTPGDLFVAMKGESYDGRHYIAEAIAQGAAAVVYEAEPMEPNLQVIQTSEQRVPLIGIMNLTNHVGPIAAHFYGYPAQQMALVGITGTNGKTSCSNFIAQALQSKGRACGIIGTLGYGFPNRLTPGSFTTPDAITLQRELAELHGQGAKVVALEVSSHSLVQQRVTGTDFTAAIFTNLTRDHLDYHGTMRRYGEAKRMLFQQPGLRYGIINLDDAFGRELVRQFQNKLELYGYTITGVKADIPTLSAHDIRLNHTGFAAKVLTPWGKGVVQSQLLGRFNISNVLAVLATLNVLGLPFAESLSSLRSLERVPGRMQVLGGGKLPTVVIDYAHTPDALEQTLLALREHCKGKLWCVFGCGGDRDRGKRPLMGKIAERCSDRLIITDDNPRTENSQQIAADIMQGILCPWATEVLYDRQAAIAHAVDCTGIGDIVVVAGKGHECYQIIGTEKFPFNDAEQAQNQLRLKRKLCKPSKGESV
ncbi:MAG: UDP-N-acetylmuramoyl-L-alanyl-D-glutamate--2,6-diaminopimelate ligase [Gammaproteobacteria bacterium]